MKLLMISGDRSVLQGKKGAFWQTLKGFSPLWERIDIICPQVQGMTNDELRMTDTSGSVIRHSSSAIRHPDFLNVFFHPAPRGLWYQPRWIVKKGSELFRQHGHQTMTVHEYPPFYNGLGAYFLHRWTCIPYCLEIHHIVGEPFAASFTEWIGRWMSRFLLRVDAIHAASVRTVNAAVKTRLVALGIPERKISVVPSFYLDANVLRPNPSIEKQFDLVFCGRLVPNKGLIELLHVVRSLPGVRLLVLGDGPLLPEAKRFVEESCFGDCVTFRGWVPDQTALVSALQSAKVFVLNSKSEGGPRIVLEAMACGMPVLTTKVGVLPEVIQDGENGLFTDGTTADLALKIMLLLENEALRRKLSENAPQILGTFERSALLKNYASFLQGIAR